ncbi:hypothetical protein M8C21_022291, partial [Ambrosia artemisiifolia]
STPIILFTPRPPLPFIFILFPLSHLSLQQRCRLLLDLSTINTIISPVTTHTYRTFLHKQQTPLQHHRRSPVHLSGRQQRRRIIQIRDAQTSSKVVSVLANEARLITKGVGCGDYGLMDTIGNVEGS